MKKGITVTRNRIIENVALVEKLASSVAIPNSMQKRSITDIIKEAKFRYFQKRYADY